MRYRRAGLAFAVGRLRDTCTGVAANPGTFNQALINANPGATFCLADGLYEMGELNIAGCTLRGSRYARFDGTVPVTNWTGPVSGVWQSTGQTYNPDVVTPVENPAMELHPENGHFADLLMDRVRLQRALSTTTPGPGQWAWDYATNIVYLGSDPTGHELRITNQTNGLLGNNFRLYGITVQWYGRMAIPDGSGRLYDDVAIVDNHGEATKFTNSVMRNCLIARNGQYGLSGGSGSVIEDTELTENNCLDFGRSTDDKSYWDAGATKFLLCQGIIFRRNWSHHNFSDGCWFDIDNRDVQFYDNTMSFNERFGLFYEINRNAQVYGNTMIDNVEGGIYISTSGPCNVYDNELQGPRALFIRDDPRGNDTIDGLPRHAQDNDLHDNIVRHRRTTTLEGYRIGFGGQDAGQTSQNNQWRRNSYFAPSTTADDWQGAASFPNYTFAQWQVAGFDTDSTLAIG